MKRTLLGIALVAGFMFMISSAFANPALLKKHDGYPTDDMKGTTATGAAAEMKAAEDAPKALKGQLINEGDQLKRGEVRSLPTPTGPGYVGHGVTENHLPEATKVNASPK